MAGTPALLLLLTLGLGFPGIQGQRHKVTARIYGRSTPLTQAGQQLQLDCQASSQDSGVFWFRQDKGGTLHFIVFTNFLSRTTFQGNEKTSTRFEARIVDNFYRLVVKSFMPEDQGNYFCLVNVNQMLYFSPGHPAFFTVTTTLTPTTQHGLTGKDPCLNTSRTEPSKDKELNFFCDTFIWVPLAGACLLLLITLVLIIILCQQTRRRRCRCKRPANEKPSVKPSMPSPHV